MVDGFYCLRHNTVVCRYNQNSNICDLCTTHTHCCKCFVTGCIQECDGFAVDLYCISTNVLCDTAGFAFCYITVTNGIQQGCFTVVNVTHNNNNGRSFFQIFFVVFFLCENGFQNVFFFFLFQNNVVIFCNGSSCIKVQCCVDVQHLTFFHQCHYQIGAFFAQHFCQFFHADGSGNGFDYRFCCFFSCFQCFQCFQFCQERRFFFHFTSSAFQGIFSGFLVFFAFALFIFFALILIVLGVVVLVFILVVVFVLIVIILRVLAVLRFFVFALVSVILFGSIFLLISLMLLFHFLLGSFFFGFFRFLCRLIQLSDLVRVAFLDHAHMAVCFHTYTLHFFHQFFIGYAQLLCQFINSHF